jgi:hypothetical protein
MTIFALSLLPHGRTTSKSDQQLQKLQMIIFLNYSVQKMFCGPQKTAKTASIESYLTYAVSRSFRRGKPLD